MSVLPELTHEQQEMMARVLGRANKLGDQMKTTGWLRRPILTRKFFLVVVIVISLLGTIGLVWEWQKSRGQEISLGQVESNIWSNMPMAASDETDTTADRSLSREQTGQSVVSGVYTVVRGRTTSLGLLANGQIRNGRARNMRDASLAHLANNQEAEQSRFELVALDIREKVLATSSVWVEGDGDIYQTTGDWTAMLYLPVGTNSVGLRERNSTSYQDRVYVDLGLPELQWHELNREYNFSGSLGASGQLVGKTQGVSLALVLQNNDFREQRIYFPRVEIDGNEFRYEINLSGLPIRNTSRWSLRMSIDSMFAVRVFSSDEFVIKR